MQAARGKTLTEPSAEPGQGGPRVQGGPQVQSDPQVQGGRPRRIGLLLVVAVTVFVADLVTKTIVVATLSDRPPIRLLGGLLMLRVLRNSGAAFSIGTSMTLVFTLIAVAVIVSILRTARRLRSLPWAITLGLLLGGATGNWGDRLFRSPGPLRGYVVDWIEMPHWPVFNMADSAIVCGGILAVLLAARGIRLDGTRERTGGSPAGAPGDTAAGGSIT
jgi:signal peptidase II